ncbi:MAG: class I SAM-dependent methyltransferase [Bacteroidales bacterium]|nr:class I SAM-dependent methyltransferase [Bacteroidales bacterium]
MGDYLESILNLLDRKSPSHCAKLRHNLGYLERDHAFKANEFFARYEHFLLGQKLSLDFSIDCYLRMIEDMNLERISFTRDGRYSSSSFSEVEERVYSSPEVMTYYMHGLVLAQFLWFEQYERFAFFYRHLVQTAGKVNSYLEIGGGHGLYLCQAIEQLSEVKHFDLVDISQFSLKLVDGIVDSEDIHYHQMDIFDFSESQTYDFITMGEVLEHVEDPLALLKKIGRLLGKNGISFISAPVNAPMIDHIYLFNNEQEIRELISTAGLRIIDEKRMASEHVGDKFAARFRVPVMYAAMVTLKNDNNG